MELQNMLSCLTGISNAVRSYAVKIVQEQLMEDVVGSTDVEEYDNELEEDDCHQKLVTTGQKEER